MILKMCCSVNQIDELPSSNKNQSQFRDKVETFGWILAEINVDSFDSVAVKPCNLQADSLPYFPDIQVIFN